MSASAWQRAVAAGWLIPIHPGVARLAGAAPGQHQRIAAAVIAAGRGAMASHRSAAFLHGIPRPDGEPVDILVPGRRGRLKLAGVCCHRPTDELRLRPQRRSNIRCTDVLRTLCDLGAVDPAAVVGAVGHVLTAKLAPLPAVELTLMQHAEHGRSGVVALRRAIDSWSIDARPADSVLEPAMARLITRYGLPHAEFHARIEGWEVDFRFGGTPVIVECDGWAYHGLRRDQFERERIRDASLTAKGWIILRFSYRSITNRSKSVADQIRAALERWASVEPPDAA